MKTIGFITGQSGAHFLIPIVDALRSKYSVVPMEGLRRDWLEQCDVLWFEWADAAFVAQDYLEGLKEQGKKIVCRIHSYEVFEQWPAQTDWSRFTDIIFVADHVREYANRHFNLAGPNQYTIWNGIDIEKYPFTDWGLNREQTGHDNKRIAVYGSINHKKGIQLAIHAFDALMQKDPSGWELNFIGEIQDARYMEYMSHTIDQLDLGAHVRIAPPAPPQEALKDMGYIAVFSPWEGCPVGLLEGMAMGCRPLIHEFPGSRKMYQHSYLWLTISDFVRIASDRKRLEHDSRSARSLVEDRFSFARQMGLIEMVVS